MGNVPFIKFDKRKKARKVLRRQMAGLSGRGKFILGCVSCFPWCMLFVSFNFLQEYDMFRLLSTCIACSFILTSVLIVSGAMAELPFGSNPFSAPASTEASNPRPTASFLARQTVPPAVASNPKVGRFAKRKERAHVAIPGGEVGKRSKTVDSSAIPPIFSTFSDLAQANFKAESVNDWKSRSDVEADFCLR